MDSTDGSDVTVTGQSVKTSSSDVLNVCNFRSQQSVADLGRECTALHHVFGVDMSRKGNLNLIEHDTIIYATTAAVVFQNVATSAKEFLLSVGDGGIGCVAVHPSRYATLSSRYAYIASLISFIAASSIGNYSQWAEKDFSQTSTYILIRRERFEFVDLLFFVYHYNF